MSASREVYRSSASIAQSPWHRITARGEWRGNGRFDAERYDVDSQGRR
jgi:hypothetical protein